MKQVGREARGKASRGKTIAAGTNSVSIEFQVSGFWTEMEWNKQKISTPP